MDSFVLFLRCDLSEVSTEYLLCSIQFKFWELFIFQLSHSYFLSVNYPLPGLTESHPTYVQLSIMPKTPGDNYAEFLEFFFSIVSFSLV